MLLFFKILLLFGALSLLLLFGSSLITRMFSNTRIFPLAEVPFRRVAVVFGAGLWRDGTATPVLYDRVQSAAQLFKDGKVEYLLMSGDNRFIDYNEPAVMREVALSFGVPESAIVLDYAGRSTYDTCYRARDIFKVDHVILVTQAFHLPRAVYTCNQLGVEAIGVEADQRQYRRSAKLQWQLRELLATVNALMEIHLTHPLPVLGDPEPILP